MREIKYKAWDIEKKKMFTVTAIYPWHKYKKGYMCRVKDGSQDRPTKNVHLLQYTGLKDRNGEEIYEGYIVRLNNLVETFVAPVVYNQDECCFDLLHPEGYRGHWGLNKRTIATCEYKVMGNIYENPELLSIEEVEKNI